MGLFADTQAAADALVFREDLESFTGQSLETLLHQIAPKGEEAVRNIGGPAIVALAAASQIIPRPEVEYYFYQHCGDDEREAFIRKNLQRYAPEIRLNHYLKKNGLTPETVVLSDPLYAEGAGGRSFLNTIGPAG